MTTSLEGRDGVPSVAALAVRLDALRRDVESLTAQVGALTGTQQDHTTALQDIAELQRQIERIPAIVSEDETTPSGWFWLTMTAQERDEKLSELHDWVETVLRPQYPDYMDVQIKRCWPNHPEASWELAWLYQLWSLAYLARRPAPKDAADWHDRWAPGVIHRLGKIMHRCDQNCRCQPPS